MKLFLTSAGLPRETREYFLKLLDKDPKKVKVAFIPTAAYPEVDKWFVKAATDELEELGMSWEVVELKNEGKDALLKKLKEFDVIYVNGGNTFYLLDWVRKSGFDQIIRQLLEEGKIYVGVSAGSIIAGPNIEVSGWDATWDKNVVGLKDLKGLSLVPFAVSPHFTELERKILEEKSKDVDYPVWAITDKQAVLVDDKKIKIVGLGEIIKI